MKVLGVSSLIVNSAVSLLLVAYPFVAQQVNVVKKFGINAISAQSLILIVGALLIGVNITVALAYFMSTDKFSSSRPFHMRYDAFVSRIRHSSLSIALVCCILLSGLNDDDLTKYRFGFHNESSGYEALKPETNNMLLWVLIVSILVGKLFMELSHGEDARELVAPLDLVSPLSADFQFKHARGAALTTGGLLMVYTALQKNLSGDYNTRLHALFSIAAYVVVVAVERAIVKFRKRKSEWAWGYVFTGLASTAMLYFTSWYVVDAKDATSVLVVLGALMLDSMRVGYGQATNDKMGDPSEASNALVLLQVLLRLVQTGIGLVVLMAIERLDIKHFMTVTPILQGVALAAVSIKILSISYVGKAILRTGSENNFRNISSVGLIVSAFLLWNLPDSLVVPEKAKTACDDLGGSVWGTEDAIECHCPSGEVGGFKFVSPIAENVTWSGLKCVEPTTCKAPSSSSPADSWKLSGFEDLPQLQDIPLDSDSWGAIKDAKCAHGFHGTPKYVSCDREIVDDASKASYTIEGCEPDFGCGACFTNEAYADGHEHPHDSETDERNFQCEDGTHAYNSQGVEVTGTFKLKDDLVCGAKKDDPLNHWSVTFLVLALLCRLFDAVMNYALKAYEQKLGVVEFFTGPSSTLLGLVAGSKDDASEGLDLPSGDNPRTYVVIGAIAVSLVSTSMLFHHENVEDLERSNVWITLVTSIVLLTVHLVVALLAVLAPLAPNMKWVESLQLSRSPLVRLLVSTGVFVSLAIAGGRLSFGQEGGDDALEGVNGEGLFLIALFSYVVADLMGRQFL